MGEHKSAVLKLKTANLKEYSLHRKPEKYSDSQYNSYVATLGR